MSSHRGLGSRPQMPALFSGLMRRPKGAGGRKTAEAPPVITLKSPREIGLMREAGRVVAKALDQVRRMGVPGVTTAEMDDAVAAIFREHDAIPLFLGYPSSVKGKPPFPAVICASINEQVVHGIPNRRPLREGDIVSIDTGCRVNGWCGDAAVTLAIGAVRPEIQKLLDVTVRDPQPGHSRNGPLPDLVGGRQPDGAVRQEPGHVRRREVRRPRDRADDARGAAGSQFREQIAAKI